MATNQERYPELNFEPTGPSSPRIIKTPGVDYEISDLDITPGSIRSGVLLYMSPEVRNALGEYVGQIRTDGGEAQETAPETPPEDK